MIRNLTYHNLMAVIHKLQKKGYTFEEAVYEVDILESFANYIFR